MLLITCAEHRLPDCKNQLLFAIPFATILLMSVTYQPKKRKRSKTHGFLKRMKSATGQNVIKRRRQKGRKKLAV